MSTALKPQSNKVYDISSQFEHLSSLNERDTKFITTPQVKFTLRETIFQTP